VNFEVSTSGKSEGWPVWEELHMGPDDGLPGGDRSPYLSFCVGLVQNGAQRLLFAGRPPPKTESQSKVLFKVAHAIFSFR